MTGVDPGCLIGTGECGCGASSGTPAGAKLAALVTGTGKPASSPWETVATNCGRVKFPSGIELAPVVPGAGVRCMQLVWFRLVVLFALCSYLCLNVRLRDKKNTVSIVLQIEKVS